MLENSPKIYPIICLFFTLIACSGPKPPEAINYKHCAACHKGIESISRNHEFECKICHLQPARQTMPFLEDHGSIIRNPSDPRWVSLFCGKCHEKEIKQVQTSLHSTMAGIINQTRYLWGAQDVAFPPIYSANHALKLLPESPLHPESPAELVDDFLRRKCLRCHLQTKGPEAEGLYRATGCAACHMLYNNKGLYVGTDKAIDKHKPSYPMVHRFTKNIPNMQCLHCHNQNHVGADYEGLFEHDYNKTYRSRAADGAPLPVIYGLDQHHLARDVHAENGLWCIDCHSQKEIMGDGKLRGYALAVPMIKCKDCHAGFFEPAPNPSLKSITEHDGRFYFHSSYTGKTYPLTLFSKETLSHSVSLHQRVRCSACHAQWSFQDYGLSVIREDYADYIKWRKLTNQGDPYLKDFLDEQIGREKIDPPASPDWLDSRLKKGAWYTGWRFRRWEWMPLGMDQNQKYSILRPKYQYFISYVDATGYVVLDNVVPQRGDDSDLGWTFMPYVPHTTSPVGRSCESCHLNNIAAGMGVFDGSTIDTQLTIPSTPVIPSMTLMSNEAQKRLLLRK